MSKIFVNANELHPKLRRSTETEPHHVITPVVDSKAMLYRAGIRLKAENVICNQIEFNQHTLFSISETNTLFF